MVKVRILVEGQTEEKFVKEVLSKHFDQSDIVPIIIRTRKVLGGPDNKGGIVSYKKVKKQLLKLLNDSSVTAVTTMIDYYGLKEDFPEVQSISESDCFERVKAIEASFNEDIDNPKFIPYLQLHEFEAILFSDPMRILDGFPGKEFAVRQLSRQRDGFESPEHINLGNPPSRRILSVLPDYDKVIFGTTIALEIGLERIRQECHHFNEWIIQLERLG